jgi:hypothetical protein
VALVGDAIQKFRMEAPDLPQVMGNPSGSAAVGAANANGLLASGGQYYIVVTAINNWGESLGDSELGPIVPGAGNNSLNVTSNAPPGATAGRAYFVGGSGITPVIPGTENQYIPLTLSATTGVLTGTILTLFDNTNNVPGAPPVRNSAFLPDTDGDEISAKSAFLWLNDALTLLSRKAGGLQDTTGINAIAQQQFYTIGGRWQRFVSFWFLGWEIQAGRRADILYRYNISGIPEVVAQEVRANQTVISWNPQPNQDGNTTQLNGAIGAVDTTLVCDDASAFQDLGRIQIDNEIMMFSQVDSTGTSITGLIRGVGGTKAVAHADNAPIQELGLWLTGFRYPSSYNPGDSIQQLDAAPSWEVPLHKYLLARYLSHIQQAQEAAAMMKEFDADAKELESELPGVVRAMQMGAPSDWSQRGLNHRLIVP